MRKDDRTTHQPAPSSAGAALSAGLPAGFVAGAKTDVIQPQRAERQLSPLHVSWVDPNDEQNRTRDISARARVGRNSDNAICISHTSISRCHAEIFPEGGRWYVRDLGSSNGTFLDDVRVQQAEVTRRSTLRLGSNGPRLHLEPAESTEHDDDAIKHISEHYFGDGDAGARTMLFRKAYHRAKKTHTRGYQWAVASVALLFLGAVTVAGYQHLALNNIRSLAGDLFYSMKTIELQIETLEAKVEQAAGAKGFEELAARREELRAMESQYNAFLDELGVLDKNMSEEDRLIFRVARIFGECELYMPEDFLENIKAYIAEWQRSDRLPRAMRRARNLDLAPTVYNEMVTRNLPPQFLYLALQESDFDSRAVGRKTRLGIAKGMWQFMPATANQYGLRTGSLVELAKYDPTDERFDTHAATRAAADYLADIYRTDAQASGLLVLASYNWGPTNIKRRIRQMPQSPRERNFWELLKHHEIPDETKRYVFLIFSAAVIGENPSLFGFEFQNPLEDLDVLPQSIGAKSEPYTTRLETALSPAARSIRQ